MKEVVKALEELAKAVAGVDLPAMVRDEVARQLAESEPGEPPAPWPWKTVFEVDFKDSVTVANYTEKMFQEDFETGRKFNAKKSSVEKWGRDNAHISHYAAGKFGNDTGHNQWVDFGAPSEVVRLSYTVRFQPGFDFGETGKLLGVGFGNVANMGSGGTGNAMKGRGASVRLNWVKNGHIRPYVYHHGKMGKYGDNLGETSIFQAVPGETYEIVMLVKANTLGKADGVLEVSVNGETLYHTGKLMLRVADSPQLIQELAYHTFIWGQVGNYVPPTNQKLGIYNIKIEIPN